MHTLIVTYLPRQPGSNTARLLDRFRNAIAGYGTTEELDLVASPPPCFDTRSMNAYFDLHYAGKDITPQAAESLQPFAALARQFKAADIVALAFPMHNFSFPGVVKCYFDAIMMRDETWSADAAGYHGWMAGKKAITLSASGGVYLDPPNPRDHLTSLARLELQFLGFSEIETVLAEGMNKDQDFQAECFSRCFAQIDEIPRRWYPKE